MKKSILILFTMAFFFCAQTVSAQFTLRLAGGYAWPGFQNSEGVTGPVIDPLHPDIDALGPMANIKDTMNGMPASYKLVKGSYGHGMNFTLGLGYTVNKYFNFELGISYLKSVTISSDQTRQLTISTGLNYSYIPAYLTAHTTTNAFGVSISPAFTVQAPIKHSKFMPYCRAGIVLPLYGGLTDHISIDQNSGIPTLVNKPYFLGKHTDVTLTTQGSLSVGINGAVGVKYNVLPYLCVFVEVNGQYLTTRAQSSKITQWDADGVSLISARGVYRTQFNYVTELNGTSNNKQYNSNPNDPNIDTKPKDDVGPTGAFSNLGLNIGVTFTLSKKTLKKPEAHTGGDK